MSNVPSDQSGEGTDPPAPALQLMPLPGICPAQFKATVESGLPVVSNTSGFVSKSSIVLKSLGVRSTISVYAVIPPLQLNL